jgi:hypothetical protein
LFALEKLDFRYTALIHQETTVNFKTVGVHYRHCIAFRLRLASTKPALLEQWHSWMHVHRYRGHDCWRLSFHFLLSHQIAFAFHGESPLQVDHLPKAVFLTITAVFFCMAQPKFPTRAG